MPRIRVLIVDDAVVIRRLLTDVLGEDPDIEVVGVAANGRIALAKLTQVNPDLIVMDVEMPEMDGLESLRALRRVGATLPVIMFSTLTERGALTTLEALSLGASDYVTKPANVGSVVLAKQRVREDLIPRIKALCGAVGYATMVPTRLPTIPPLCSGSSLTTSVGAGGNVDVVAIGVSTGGPNALAALLPLLPRGFGVPIVIVQHMPPLFTTFLADRLNGLCNLPVDEGRAGAAVEPGTIWIAPGDFHMTLDRAPGGVHLQTDQAPPENSCRPSVDVLFRSAARVYGSRVLAVVLTGMGQDGLRGCQMVRESGGQVVAQDEASSVVWGMPGYVAQAGLAHRVLPLDQIGAEIVRRTTRVVPRAVRA